MEAPHHILVVDDDRRLRDLLEKYLSLNGYLVTVVEGASVARQALNSETFSLIILDVMMPDESGFEFCRWLRGSAHPQHGLPILMLTALGEPAQRVEGLESGADDYMSKPFEPKELLIRLRRLVAQKTDTRSKEGLVTFGPYLYDCFNQKLLKNGYPVCLTSTELSLLSVLASSPRVPLSREMLVQRGGTCLTLRTVDVQITRLRRKLEPRPRFPTYIRTVRHQGYAFWPDD